MGLAHWKHLSSEEAIVLRYNQIFLHKNMLESDEMMQKCVRTLNFYKEISKQLAGKIDSQQERDDVCSYYAQRFEAKLG